VIDNGIGREASKALKSLHASNKYKSLGMKITKDRLRLLNTMQQSNLSVNITDMYNADKKAIGTQVDLYIPYVK
jgi:Fe2+ or Zn2+ uptake regulation protein